MQQEIYPNQNALAVIPSQRRFKICGLLDMQYGGPLICFLWTMINMYACVLAFQFRSPIYSYLNHPALIAQGIICLWFVISALLSLYAFTLNMPKQLRTSHRLTWISVIIFLIDYFVNMVIFCVQKGPFNDWCLSRSRTDTTYQINSAPDSSPIFANSNLTSPIHLQVSGFTPIHPGSDLYNCSRLWEDEIKFSVVVFVILFVLYIHFAFCFWCYTQDRMAIQDQIFDAFNNPQNYNNAMMMNAGNNMVNPNLMMNNLKPGTKYCQRGQEGGDDGQKSLAQLTRAVFGRLR